MLMRAYEIAPDTDLENNFSDAGDTWYTGWLAEAKRLEISAGVGNNLFAPEKEITRQEMFTLLYNALNVIGQLPAGTAGNPLSSFDDAVQIAPWAKDAMALFAETGSGGRIYPTDAATRAETAQLLYNLFMS